MRSRHIGSIAGILAGFGISSIGLPTRAVAHDLLAQGTASPALTVVARAPEPGAPTGVTAFVDVNVVPMDTERVLPKQTVIVEGGWITALGSVNQVQIPAGATRIDGYNKYLLPGLSDMHAHRFRSSSDGVEPWLNAGVTTIRVMDSWRNKYPPLPGPFVRHSSGLWVYSPPNNHFKTYYEDSTALAALAAQAREGGPPLMGHVPPKVSLEFALGSGIRSIEHLTGYGLRGDTSTARIRALAETTQRAKVWNTPTLKMLYWAVSSDSAAKAYWMTLAMRHVKILHEAGAGLLLGTDGFSSFAPGWVSRELKLFVEAGLTPYHALLTGTRNVAEFYGKLAESGTVAAGKRADLVLLNGNPLQDILQTRQLAGVMAGGRWQPLQPLPPDPPPPSSMKATKMAPPGK